MPVYLKLIENGSVVVEEWPVPEEVSGVLPCVGDRVQILEQSPREVTGRKLHYSARSLYVELEVNPVRSEFYDYTGM